MTAQIMDKIDFAGKVFEIACEPLRPWLNIRRNRKLRFSTNCSGLQRGYRTQWAVVDGNLFLTAFTARDKEGKDIDLSSLFPEADNKVLATWFSGAIVCPMGRMVRYEHWGYGSVWEYNLILWFIEGQLIEQRINRNPSDQKANASEDRQWSDDIDENLHR